MPASPSLIRRVGVAKLVGLAFGAAGFVCLPWFLPDADPLLRWGILLWYTTVGAVIGVFGVITEHPVLHLPMPWWIRAPMVGAWMNFVLVFFAYEPMHQMLLMLFGEGGGGLTSPFWFVLEGAIVGAVIGFAATRYGGEGRALLAD